MIQSLLIANRGEIAVRIIRTCREMGIRTVVAYSQADADSLPVRMADGHVCVGPAPARESYLNVRNLVTAAVLSGCDAVHPGVGFLAENAGFARDVKEAGLTFVGPEPQVIDLLGDKIRAKKSAQELSIPVIPGSAGSVADAREALKAAESIGYPVIVKAAAGGGGKGMRIVHDASELADVLLVASHEAEKAFSDGTVYLEKYLENPRHVEIQIVGDSRGNVVHLGERDCTVQQNHQKLIEESPSPVVTPELRARMGEDAVRLLRGLGYTGAGTVEFLVKDGAHYFMEVNARVQVEHPVSELVTGVDIIRQQILAASGEALEIRQGDVKVGGYAVECRINASSAGRVTQFMSPGGYGVRMDTFLYVGYNVPPWYDHLVAKLIVTGQNRAEGLRRMQRALSELVIEGIRTNIESQKKIIAHPVFRSGNYGTGFLGEVMKEGGL
ncbi:MAG TPA: acetyl-CoA carboxylase biotin carboxylase subunit [Spirochaetia bacterium]|nr:acetyl-CoA carboxylase biotin carboxylase subunit [Spirochaetia bacterium]